jgi:hypothetical protein
VRSHVSVLQCFIGIFRAQQSQIRFNFCVVEYLAEVDRVETTEKEETKASELFNSGDSEAQGVVELIKRVQSPDQLPLFYSGGFRIIGTLINTSRIQN